MTPCGAFARVSARLPRPLSVPVRLATRRTLPDRGPTAKTGTPSGDRRLHDGPGTAGTGVRRAGERRAAHPPPAVYDAGSPARNPLAPSRPGAGPRQRGRNTGHPRARASRRGGERRRAGAAGAAAAHDRSAASPGRVPGGHMRGAGARREPRRGTAGRIGTCDSRAGPPRRPAGKGGGPDSAAEGRRSAPRGPARRPGRRAAWAAECGSPRPWAAAGERSFGPGPALVARGRRTAGRPGPSATTGGRGGRHGPPMDRRTAPCGSGAARGG